MSRLNQTLTLITLLLLTLAISCTSIRSLETLNPPTNSSSNSNSSSSEGVPEWFENCVLHWVFRVNYADTLVDTQPFTTFCGSYNPDERVARCWDNETLAAGEPRERGYGVSPNDASPWVLEALKKLVAKGLVKPFSLFEERSRIYGVRWAMEPPLDRYARSTRQVFVDYVWFQRSMEQGCTDAIRDCDDDSYTSCDPHSLEYWCHFFRINHIVGFEGPPSTKYYSRSKYYSRFG